MQDIFFIGMLVALGLNFLSLTAGIVVMGKGGETARKHGNTLMKTRVYLQGITIMFFALFLLTST